MMTRRILIMLSLLTLPLFISGHAMAADIFDKNLCNRDAANQSAVCKDKNLPTERGETQNPLFGPEGILTKVINILSVIVGIVAVITIILAGLRYVTSGTNPQDVSNARERVIYSLVALAVAASAQVLVRFILGNS